MGYGLLIPPPRSQHASGKQSPLRLKRNVRETLKTSPQTHALCWASVPARSAEPCRRSRLGISAFSCLQSERERHRPEVNKSLLFPIPAQRSPASCSSTQSAESDRLVMALVCSGAVGAPHRRINIPLLPSPPSLLLFICLNDPPPTPSTQVAATQARGRKLIWPQRFRSCP